jgi:hypothetical protein
MKPSNLLIRYLLISVFVLALWISMPLMVLAADAGNIAGPEGVAQKLKTAESSTSIFP